MNVMGMQGHGNAETLGVNSKNVGNQAGDARNQDRNLSMTVEIIQNSNGNDKFKKQRQVKIIENKYIYENKMGHLSPHIDHFLTGKKPAQSQQNKMVIALTLLCFCPTGEFIGLL